MLNRNYIFLKGIFQFLLFFVIGGFAANFIWGWAMERIGLTFVPIADALIRIGVVFLFFELLIWWKPGTKAIIRYIRHFKQLINRIRKTKKAISISVRQTRVLQIVLSVIMLGLCFSQFNFLVHSATKKHAANSSSVELYGAQFSNGQIIEFAAKDSDIDPINIQISVSGVENIRFAAWWDSPRLEDWENISAQNVKSPLALSFKDAPYPASGKIEAIGTDLIRAYCVGYPLSRDTNSLFLYIEGSPVIEEIVFNGERFYKGGKWLKWDR